MKEKPNRKKFEVRIATSIREVVITVKLESPSDMDRLDMDEDGVVDEVTGKIIPFSKIEGF